MHLLFLCIIDETGICITEIYEARLFFSVFVGLTEQWKPSISSANTKEKRILLAGNNGLKYKIIDMPSYKKISHLFSL